MPIYDLIMLLILVSATIFGAIKGFAWQVASLASIFLSYFVAYNYRNDVAKMIDAREPWNQFLAMLLLYAGSSFVIWMVFRLVSGSIDKVKLKEFDRQLGAGFGFIKGALLCLIVTMFAMTLLDSQKQEAICRSRSGYYISKFLAGADGLLPSEVEQVIGPALTRLENQLNQHRNDDSVFASQPMPPADSSGWRDGIGWPAAGDSQFKNPTGQPNILGQAASQFQETAQSYLQNGVNQAVDTQLRDFMERQGGENSGITSELSRQVGNAFDNLRQQAVENQNWQNLLPSDASNVGSIPQNGLPGILRTPERSSGIAPALIPSTLPGGNLSPSRGY